jgi:hypothetical protein
MNVGMTTRVQPGLPSPTVTHLDTRTTTLQTNTSLLHAPISDHTQLYIPQSDRSSIPTTALFHSPAEVTSNQRILDQIDGERLKYWLLDAMHNFYKVIQTRHHRHTLSLTNMYIHTQTPIQYKIRNYSSTHVFSYPMHSRRTAQRTIFARTHHR